MDDEIGERLRSQGVEFGATTGRPRRCGWLDLVVLRHAVRVNGLTGIVITKLDVLSGLDRLRICTAYRCQGKLIKEIPSSIEELGECEPVYLEMKGWKESLQGVRRFGKLPLVAQRYLKKIESLAGVKIIMVSVGPGRDENILLKNPF